MLSYAMLKQGRLIQAKVFQMIGLFKAALSLVGIVLTFYFLLKGITKKDQQQFRKAFIVLIATAGLLISITVIEFAMK